MTTTDIQLRQSDALPELAGATAAADPFGPFGRGNPPEGQATLFTKLHRLLRGRYKWVVLLGGTLGGACGYWGYTSQQPIYASTGMIHIKPVIAHLLYVTPENAQLPMYNPYREAQVALLKDQRVIDKALLDPEWQRLKRPGTQEEQWAGFVRQFSANAPAGNEMVVVRFEDADPAACKAAVKAVLTAYQQIYITEEELSRTEKVRQLDTRRMSLTADRDAKREQITAIAANALTDDLRPVHAAKMADLNRLDSAIKDVEIRLAQLAQGAAATRPASPGPERPKKSPVEMTVADIALVDRDMRRLVAERDRMQREYEARVRALGPNNPRMVEARTNLELKLAEVEDHADQWRKAAVAGAGGDDGLILGDPRAQLRRQLEDHRWELEELRTKARNEAKGVAQKMLDIEKLRREEGEINELLAETAKRLEQMKTEANNTPRVQVVSWGNRPLQVKDSRLQMAAVGGGGGLAVGFGVVIGLGLLDRRLRSAEDAQTSSKLTLLGVLPSLPDDLADPEQAGAAAHCVHQIRTLLQIGHASQDRRVFAVTSPASGTGKTSLTLALGVSFAASNARTLVIDCDVVGGGLTHRVERIIKRRIGQIFRREGLVTQQQLELATKLASNSQRKLGEILVELGFLTADDVRHALDLQDGNPVGILDALAGEPLEDCVAESGIAGLHVLPLGSAMPSDVSKLSPHTVGKLIRAARQQYDVVLIDTGPVPGSLEASVVAAEVDGVVMVVSRGEHRPLAERSIQHLQDIGARVAGMVFNRAEGRDMNLSTTNQRLSSIDRGGRKQDAEAIDPAQGEKFGPVALAVANRQPHGRNGTQQNQREPHREPQREQPREAKP